MGKVLGASLAAMALVAAGLVLAVAVVAGAGSPAVSGSPSATSGSGGAGSGAGGTASSAAAVPPAWLTLYRQAAATCPGLSWSVPAAIGTVETGNGTSDLPGVWAGSNAAGAEGPMQFEPGTFGTYATVGPGGVRPPSPYDPVDAVYSAVTMLCADGAGSASSLRAAVLDYNHSDAYANTVLTLAVALGDAPATSGGVVAALEFAARQLGTPYLWGGTGAGGFDCSGLTQAAYASAGVALPRVAQAQADAGPAVPAGSPVLPGDLVFFGAGPDSVEHVGLYVGGGEMIDAPHTGATVRFDSAGWSGFVGATRPG